MRYEPEHKQKTREKVLKAAAKAIRAQGPHRVGVASVMRDAGLTHGGFYAHFGSKDDLVAAAIDQMFEQGRAKFRSTMDQLSSAEALAAYIDFYLSPTHRDARSSGCPMPALAADLPRLSRAARQRFSAGVQNLSNALTEHIQALGLPDASSVANSMVAELVGALSLARAEPDLECSNNLLANSRHHLKQRLGLERTHSQR